MKFDPKNVVAHHFNNRPVAVRMFHDELVYVDGTDVSSSKIHRPKSVVSNNDQHDAHLMTIHAVCETIPVCVAQCLMAKRIDGNMLSEFGLQPHRDLFKSLGVTIL